MRFCAGRLALVLMTLMVLSTATAGAVPRSSDRVGHAISTSAARSDDHSGVPLGRAAFHATYFNPGYSDCPTVFPSGATLSQIFVTPPLLYAALAEYYYFYNGIATRQSGWQVVFWEGPYWVYAPLWDRVYSPQLGWLWTSDGGGGSTFTINRDDALGVHWIADYQTGQSFANWTYAVRDGGRGYCEDYSGLFGASRRATAAHNVRMTAAARYLERYVGRTREILENPEDPIVPGASTTVTWHSSGCEPRRRDRPHRHKVRCGYDLRVVVAPNEGSSAQFRALRCGDPRVFVKFRSKRSQGLQVVSDDFRCRRDQGSGEAPPGAPQQPIVTPPPPPTGPPPPPPNSQ